jgi:hypothetical protein
VFKVESWIPPVRDENKKIIRSGFWKKEKSVDSEEEAKTIVKSHTGTGKVVRAVSENIEIRTTSTSFYIVRKG